MFDNVEDQEIELYDGGPVTAVMPIPRYPAIAEGIKIKDLPKATPEEQIERMFWFRKIVAEHQYQPVRWYDRAGKKRQLQVDATSAGMVCQVYDKLSEDARALLCAMEPAGMISFGWKLVR